MQFLCQKVTVCVDKHLKGYSLFHEQQGISGIFVRKVGT